MSAWIRKGKPDLRPQLRRELATAAVQSLDRFIYWLDFKGTRIYCEQVAQLFSGVRPDEVLWQLRHHPWSDVLP